MRLYTWAYHWGRAPSVSAEFSMDRTQSNHLARARQGRMSQADDSRSDRHRQLRLRPQRRRPVSRRRLRAREGAGHGRGPFSRDGPPALRSLEPGALSRGPPTCAVPLGSRLLVRRLDGQRLRRDPRGHAPRHPAPGRLPRAFGARSRRHGPRDSRRRDLVARAARRARLPGGAGALAAMRRPIQGLVVAGHDSGLKATLSRLTEGTTIRTLGYVGDVRRLMAAADLLVTKAGGMTLAEAMAAETPLLLYGSLPGQERRNERFAARAGIALVARRRPELTPLLEWALSEPDLLERLRAQMRRLRRPGATDRIVSAVLGSGVRTR